MERTDFYLSFEIGSEMFAANVKNVSSIIEIQEITKVPDMPTYMLGVINLRGAVLPVIDTRKRFGIEEKDLTTNSCIIVVEVEIENEIKLIGALVDGVSEVIELKENQILESPQVGIKEKKEYIMGVFPQNNKFTMILDMQHVFNLQTLGQMYSA